MAACLGLPTAQNQKPESLSIKTALWIRTHIKDLKNISNSQLICFIIAENLKEKGAESIFLNRSMVRLFSEQILAARFLVKYNII